jgi:MipA family protein
MLSPALKNILFCCTALCLPSAVLGQTNIPVDKPVLEAADDAPAAPAGGPRRGPPPEDPTRLTFGLGGGIGPSYEGSNAYDFQPGGIIQGAIDGIEFGARGTNLYVDFVRDSRDRKTNFNAGPIIQLNLDRTNGIKDAQVRALGEKATTLEIGGFFGISKRGVLIPPASLSAEIGIVKGVSGAHRSWIATPSIALSSPLSDSAFARISLSADYVGKGYGRAYFDVDAAGSAASGLPLYATNGSGFKSIGTTLLITRDLGGEPRKGLSLFALTGYKRLLGQYARSPIVRDAGSADQFLGVVGVAYGF